MQTGITASAVVDREVILRQIVGRGNPAQIAVLTIKVMVSPTGYIATPRAYLHILRRSGQSHRNERSTQSSLN